MKPHIDALKMEAVIAFWEQSSLLPIGELAETNGAFEPVLKITPVIDSDGKRTEDGGVEATAGDRCIVSSEDELGSSADARSPIVLGV